MKPRLNAIIQARMSSSRLPGKVLLEIAGQPMLVHVVERTRRAQAIDEIIIATTTDPSDDAIQTLCDERSYICYRGQLHDVLDRYYQAARASQAQAIVRITADCPLIDPLVIDDTVAAFFSMPATGAGHFDFAANRLPPPWKRTYPIGLDTEICSFSALERAWEEADQPYQREHAMPYIYEGVVFDAQFPAPRTLHSNVDTCSIDSGITPHGFQIALLNHHPDYGSMRWTVDTPADLELVRQIFLCLAGEINFTWLDILALFAREPELARINIAVQHKSAYDVDSRTNP